MIFESTDLHGMQPMMLLHKIVQMININTADRYVLSEVQKNLLK